MAKKVPVEIKANVVKHFLASKCTFEGVGSKADDPKSAKLTILASTKQTILKKSV